MVVKTSKRRNVETTKRFQASAASCLRPGHGPSVPDRAFVSRRTSGCLRAAMYCLLAVGFSAFPSSAQAAGRRVLSLGLGRGYDHQTLFQAVMTGESMATARAALVADGFTFTAGESFMAGSLSGYDIVFLGLFDPAERLSRSEVSALDAFVRQGGALIYVGDNDHFQTPNDSVGGMFGITFRADAAATVADMVHMPSHATLDGPGGVVRAYNGSQNLQGFFGGMNGLGSQARAVLGTDTRTVIAVIERDRLQPGSGPVILVSEANGFQDPPVGSIDQDDNLALIRNIFAFAAAGGLVCGSDADCADGRFCNGVESCVDTVCVDGSFPCPAGEGCHEDLDRCGPCENDDQCYDGLFCNGDESCAAGVCRAGEGPCPPGEGCHEEDDSCGPCRDNGDCDDGLFCNGQESCGASQVCQAGQPPCGLACERCDEGTQTCRPCIFDLDADGFIGTGDFAIFAGCFGACYPADHACQEANFDGSDDGCVGTGDFGAFSGCFGAPCETCDNCDGPGETADALAISGQTAGAALELVALTKPSKLEAVDLLPGSVSGGQVGDVLYVELWAGRGKPLQESLAAVYTNLRYDARLVSVLEIMPSATFALFAEGRNNPAAGEVAALGGCAQPSSPQDRSTTGQRPAAGAWTKVATLTIRLERVGQSSMITGSAGDTFGISVIGQFGNMQPANVSFGRLYLSAAGESAIINRPQYSNTPGFRK